jgi:uncharacterized damage-inducible protein DinB
MIRFVDVLLAEFDRESALTRRLLVRVPTDRLVWRPHDRSRTLGHLVTHLADLPAWGAALVERAEYDLDERALIDRSESSIEAVLSLFDANIGLARRAVSARTDAELLAPLTLRRGGKEIFTVPRLIALRTMLLQHATHHRGQLSVYLRLLDVPLPPMYGPTADEPF